MGRGVGREREGAGEGRIEGMVEQGSLLVGMSRLPFSYSNAWTIISNLSRSFTSSASGVVAASYSSQSAEISAAASGVDDRFDVSVAIPS